MTNTRDRIPAHLRPFVVDQDYGAYDEIDQAVWRFILLQTYARLRETAHPAYTEGLRQTGISVERIPRLDEMDRCLSEYGWGAVAVDGFIPPRAFQELQAMCIMAIAADIRSADHLAYTPAPDIVHESAGHAPIVPDPAYRTFLQRFGAVGARAFSCPGDRRVEAAIYALSASKEDPAASASQIARAERELADSETALSFSSEAALMSRLHWWTVEYGLVGSPERYQIYGAGLLSSLGECHFCHRPEVAKLPLSARCTLQSYDITCPQPQLYVAEDFAQLTSVLDEVASGLSQNVGGAVALERALASEELATLELSTGLQIIGVLSSVRGSDEPAYLQLSGPCALARGGSILPGHARDAHPEGYGTPLGRLEDGTALSTLSETQIRARAASGLALRFKSGVEVRGRLEHVLCGSDGRLLLLSLSDCRVCQADELLFDPAWGVYDMAVGESVASAFAGSTDPAYWSPPEFSHSCRPRRTLRQGEEAALLDLYREAIELWERPDAPDLVERFEDLAEALRSTFPKRWLLRWNLLECLAKTSRGAALADRLRSELLAIERERPDDLPISMGLSYLDEQHPG